MAMFCYNPKKLEKNIGKEGIWEAKIDENKLVVCRYEDQKHEKCVETYYVEGFHNCSGFELKDEKGEDDHNNIWYSFDPDRSNFHIVPDKSLKVDGTTVFCALKTKLKQIGSFLPYKEYLKEIDQSNDNFKWHWFKGNASKSYYCTNNHQLVWINADNYQYLVSFNRLWCDDKNHIHNNFGQAQFMRFKSQINKAGSKFKMMYPSSGDDGEGRCDLDSGHLSYNAPFNIKSNASDIAKAFEKFIYLGKTAETGEIKDE